MKFDNNKQTNNHNSSGQKQLSSQETTSSFYKTSKKKSLSKKKGSATGSTNCTGSSQQKKCYKSFNSGGTALKINFDEYNTNQDICKGMDQPQHGYIQSQSQRQCETQSQNFGYCDSQFEDDLPNLSCKMIQEEQNDYDNRQENFNLEYDNSNFMFPQASSENTIIQQQQNLLIKNQQSCMIPMQQQQQYINKQSREMIVENVNPQINKSESTQSGNQQQSTLSTNYNNNIMNNENEIQIQQSLFTNSRKQSERTFLGDITDQHRSPTHSFLEEEEEPQYDEEEQGYNNNQKELQQTYQQRQSNTSNEYSCNNQQEYTNNSRKEIKFNNKFDSTMSNQQYLSFNNQQENSSNNKENQYSNSNKDYLYNIQQRQLNDSKVENSYSNKQSQSYNNYNENSYSNKNEVSHINRENSYNQNQMINRNNENYDMNNDDDDYEEGNLFNPVDHENFIGSNQYQGMQYQQYNNSNSSYMNNNSNIYQNYIGINQQNVINQIVLRKQENQQLTMAEMLEQFEQDDYDEDFSFDKQDLLILQQRQIIYYIHSDNLRNYEGNFTNFPKKRTILIDWMQEVSSHFHFKRETYQQSISIVDRYFQNVSRVPKNQLQLVGATALLIAHKLEEVICWKIEDFIQACNNGYSQEQFLQMERNICETLQFNFSASTAYFWMNQLMLLWDGLTEQYELIFFDGDMIFFKKDHEKSFKLLSQVCQYIDCCFYDINVYDYPITQIISAFISPNPITLEGLQNTKSFTYQFLDLQINQIDLKSLRINKREERQSQSYENICSQQIFNQEAIKLFGNQ